MHHRYRGEINNLTAVLTSFIAFRDIIFNVKTPSLGFNDAISLHLLTTNKITLRLIRFDVILKPHHTDNFPSIHVPGMIAVQTLSGRAARVSMRW